MDTSNDQRSTSDVLYGSSAPSQAASALAGPDPPATADVPERFEFPPAADTEMFRVDVGARPGFIDRQADALNVAGLTRQQYQTDAKAHVELLREAALEPTGLGLALWNHQIDAVMREARGDVGPTVEDIHQMTVKAREAVRGLYGDQTDELVARARKFVSSHPKLLALMNTQGIGSQPDVVLKVVEHVRRVDYR